MALAFSLDGLLLATGSRDHSVKVWDLGTFEERASVSEQFGFVPSIAFHADEIAFGDWFGSVRLWNPRTDKLRLIGHFERAIYGVAFSPDGRLLAAAGYDHWLRLWDVVTGSQLERLPGHSGSVQTVAFSPDGRLIASGSADQTIRFWSVNDRKIERVLIGHAQGVNSVAFSPDGRRLASASADGTFRLWEIFPNP